MLWLWFCMVLFCLVVCKIVMVGLRRLFSWLVFCWVNGLVGLLV